jgi:hypothetical protein
LPEAALPVETEIRRLSAKKAKCGARLRGERAGKTCTHQAGWGTKHPGEGRCKLHGGATPRGVDSPHFKHGTRSRFPVEWVRLDKTQLERIRQIEKMPSVDRLDRSIALQLAVQEDAAAVGDHRSVGVLGAAVASSERAKVQRQQAERMGGASLRLPQLVVLGITMTEAELEERQQELTRAELAAIDVPYTLGEVKSAT